MILDTFVCVDLETTGLNPKTDKITEVGAVKVHKGEIIDQIDILINPGRKLEERIIELTGLTDDLLQDKPYISDVLDQIEDFIGEDVLLGHSVLFDYSFLKVAFVNNKRTFEREGIDTLKLARRFLPELESRSLGFLCKHYQIQHTPHRAMEDAKSTVELYKKLAQNFYKEETKDAFLPQKLNYQVKRQTPITNAQIERLQNLVIRHKIQPDYEIEKLTRNEASRIIDRIYLEFGR